MKKVTSKGGSNTKI